jgi:hypothetical protein
MLLRSVSSAVLGLAAVFQLSGCSSLTRKYDAARAGQVKKIVVLSFEIQQEQPKDALGLSKLGELKEGRRGDRPEFQAMATNVYNTLLAELTRKTKWNTVSLKELTSNAAYAKRVTDSTTGFHQVSMTNQNAEIVNVNSVLNNVAYRKMSYQEKVNLAKAYGADAFAEILIPEQIDQGYSFGNLTGNAPFKFTGRANLIVHGLNSEEPLWQIQNVDGQETQRSDKLPGDLDQFHRLAKLGEDAANSAIKTLIEDFGK